ncbi:anaerobic sulfite reductase subunit AsrA [Desulfocucumis palustris]|uniref:Anaerobic sulfite reductase subunit AsrA n=1 Tax=Desulfocucumis palustris TaxID=1898651 RepID=A0A2L2XDX0_9FIRM|nr:anaerobic sulfite reductase subunit AsrA [Desulfocucumis palustris]
MAYWLDMDSFNGILKELSADNVVYAPVKMTGKGAFSGTDLVAYREISGVEQIEFKEKSRFSPKEIVFPITQTLLYFTEEEYAVPGTGEKGIIVFCRPCDVNAFKRLDEIFLRNGGRVDSYYRELREKVRFFVIECAESFDSCFCVSMGTNRADGYDVFIRAAGGGFLCDVRGDLATLFEKFGGPAEMSLRFIEENKTKVSIPESVDQSVFGHGIWREYASRCIACGRCTVSCPTCSCFTMQDIFYEDNPNRGERRRVWASCMIDGFTAMAGGHGFREDHGDRMRFKLMHKISDFRKRFGYNMCVGCGRCDDVCPEYISFARAINRVDALMKEAVENV